MNKNKIICKENQNPLLGAFAFEYSFPENISNNHQLIIEKINGDYENAILNLYIL